MGTIYNRGTRTNPNWYVAYKDETGRRRAIPSGQTTKAQAKEYLREVESRVARIKAGIEAAPVVEPMCGELLQKWAAGLRNRSAKDDHCRLRLHVMPRFGESRLSEVTLAALMRWIDDQRAAGKLSDATIRHNLNLVSRFFSWAIERGHAQFNPVRQIPTGKRPQMSAKKDVPWLQDDDLARQLIRELPEPLSYMFYLGNRSGLRSGEIVGLRMSDLDFLSEGLIRVRFSGDGPLKEDKNEKGKTKWAPAADDAAAYLAPWLDKRRAAGAGPEDYVFPSRKNPDSFFRQLQIQRHWRKIRKRYGLAITFYQATRHTFTSRSLAAGASLDEVSAALGHSSPTVTRRFYDHYVRRTFSPVVRQGLGLGGESNESRIGKPAPDESTAVASRPSNDDTRPTNE